ncbi:MAG TPA: hypothetical protein V6C72_19760 [Chroococcales cyanobacterium]
MPNPLDDTSEKQKLSDKDSKANFSFPDIMNGSQTSHVVNFKAETLKATQNLVDKRILAPITIVQDAGKGNPLRQKGGKKRKSRTPKELVKFEDEIVSRIPPDKLAALLENQDQLENAELPDTVKQQIKRLLAAAEASEDDDDQYGAQKEVVVPHVAAFGATSLAGTQAGI